MRHWPDRVGGLAATALLAAPVAAQLAPHAGQSFRVSLVDQRSDGGATRQFSAERTVVFHPLADGFAIDVTTVPASVTDVAPDSRMFAAGMAALAGRTIRFRVDGQGALKSIDDEDAIWDAFCAAIEAMGQTGKRITKPLPRATAMALPMRDAPPAVRRAMLFSMVAPLIAGPLADEVPGTTRAVSLPVRAPTGMISQLIGVQHVSVDGNGALLITTDAEGELAAWHDSAPSSPKARVKLNRVVRIDRSTGLVLETRERRETVIGNGKGAPRSVSLSKTLLKPMVS